MLPRACCKLELAQAQPHLTRPPCNRSGWHLSDKVRIIHTLRWRELVAQGFANLRHANMVCPEVWDCHYLQLDWRWSGNWLHPTDWTNDTALLVSLYAICLVKLRLSSQCPLVCCRSLGMRFTARCTPDLPRCSLAVRRSDLPQVQADDEYVDSYLMAKHWDGAFAGGASGTVQLLCNPDVDADGRSVAAALGPLPAVMNSPCCSEFVVSRERIRARPKAFYKRLRYCWNL